MDYSKLSTKELEKLVADSEAAQTQQSQGNETGYLQSALQGYGNYAKGALKGTGQALGDFGVSALNLPISGLEHLTGRKIPHVPHPHLINENPESLGESIGQTLGQIGGGLAIPGGIGFKTAQLANRAYQGVRGAKELPLIAKLLSGGIGGATEGYIGNEEDRPQGAELGALLGGAGHAIPAAINFAKSIGSKNIAKQISEVTKQIQDKFSPIFTKALQSGEEAGANQYLRPQKGNIALIKRAGETGGKKGEKALTYSLEKYNKEPTLTNAHNAQRDLGKIERLHSGAPEGSLEHDAYKQALKLKNRLLEQISNSFKKSGAEKHGNIYQQARTDYYNEASPYLNSPSIGDLLGKNKAGKQTLRPGKFADKLLQEEDFLTRSGQNHPGLLRREKYNALKQNPFAKGAALGTAALATPFLPYAIAKALGLR